MKLIVTILLIFNSGAPLKQDLVSVANSFLNEKNYVEAKSAIDEALKDDKFLENPRAWYTKGRVYHEILKSQNATLNRFKTNMDKFVGDIVEAYNKTKTLTTTGSNLYISASNHMQLLWAEGINQGVMYFQTRKFDKAFDAFTIAQLTKPADTTAYIYKGLSARHAERYDEALENFYTIKTLAPMSKDVHNNIIICTRAKGATLQQQLDVIEDAIFDFPDHIPYVIEEVKTLIRLGRFTETESRLKTVSQRNPTAYELKILQADLYDRIFLKSFIEGKPERSDQYFEMASKKYQEYIDAFPNSFDANYNYAVMINEKANRFYVKGNLMTKEEYEIEGEEVQEKGHVLTRKALPFMERARLLSPNNPKTVEALRVFYGRLKMDTHLAALNDRREDEEPRQEQ